MDIKIHLRLQVVLIKLISLTFIDIDIFHGSHKLRGSILLCYLLLLLLGTLALNMLQIDSFRFRLFPKKKDF